MTSYMERLLRLADNSTLRSELAQFPLAADAENAILPEHREGLHAEGSPLSMQLGIPRRKCSGAPVGGWI